jgi:hypothetical protein
VRAERDAKLSLAVVEDGLQLRIAFEAFRHIAHRRAHRLVAGYVARLILAQADSSRFCQRSTKRSARRFGSMRKIAEGTFPAQLKISANGTGWHESDINRWIADPASWRPKREFDEIR